MPLTLSVPTGKKPEAPPWRPPPLCAGPAGWRGREGRRGDTSEGVWVLESPEKKVTASAEGPVGAERSRARDGRRQRGRPPAPGRSLGCRLLNLARAGGTLTSPSRQLQLAPAPRKLRVFSLHGAPRAAAGPRPGAGPGPCGDPSESRQVTLPAGAAAQPAPGSPARVSVAKGWDGSLGLLPGASKQAGSERNNPQSPK